MYKLYATIVKDFRVLKRDKVGLTLMFAMPIVLALIITAVQNSTFELVNHNKIQLLLCNKDTGEVSRQLVTAIKKTGMFAEIIMPANEPPDAIITRMHAKDALVALVIPTGFSD